MPDPIEIRVGGVGLLLTRADAASVAAQLADAGIAAEAVRPDGALIIGDDHPMWALHSGGARHDAPDWEPADAQLAQAQYRLPPLTAKFHRALVDHPGQLLSVEDLEHLTGGALRNSRAIAGALAGYVQWCKRLDRRFPFYWWEGRDGESTRYAMQPRVAVLFQAAASGQLGEAGTSALRRPGAKAVSGPTRTGLPTATGPKSTVVSVDSATTAPESTAAARHATADG